MPQAPRHDQEYGLSFRGMFAWMLLMSKECGYRECKPSGIVRVTLVINKMGQQ